MTPAEAIVAATRNAAKIARVNSELIAAAKKDLVAQTHLLHGELPWLLYP